MSPQERFGEAVMADVAIGCSGVGADEAGNISLALQNPGQTVCGELRSLAFHLCRVGLTTQEPVRFTGDQEGAGVIVSRLHGSLLVSSRGRAALRPAIKGDTHLTGILGESHGKVDYRPEQNKPKQPSNDSRS
jgi:hypothetical protein